VEKRHFGNDRVKGGCEHNEGSVKTVVIAPLFGQAFALIRAVGQPQLRRYSTIAENIGDDRGRNRDLKSQKHERYDDTKQIDIQLTIEGLRLNAC
jgi:hypothetical protein